MNALNTSTVAQASLENSTGPVSQVTDPSKDLDPQGNAAATQKTDPQRGDSMRGNEVPNLRDPMDIIHSRDVIASEAHGSGANHLVTSVFRSGTVILGFRSHCGSLSCSVQVNEDGAESYAISVLDAISLARRQRARECDEDMGGVHDDDADLGGEGGAE